MTNNADTYELKIYEKKGDSDKAVRVSFQIIVDEIDTQTVEAWFPKSQTSVEGNTLLVPGWLIQAKADSISANIDSVIKIVALNRETGGTETFKSGG